MTLKKLDKQKKHKEKKAKFGDTPSSMQKKKGKTFYMAQ